MLKVITLVIFMVVFDAESFPRPQTPDPTSPTVEETTENISIPTVYDSRSSFGSTDFYPMSDSSGDAPISSYTSILPKFRSTHIENTESYTAHPYSDANEDTVDGSYDRTTKSAQTITDVDASVILLSSSARIFPTQTSGKTSREKREITEVSVQALTISYLSTTMASPTEDTFTVQPIDHTLEGSTNEENTYSDQTSIEQLSTAMWVTDLPQETTDESPAPAQTSTVITSPTEDTFTVQPTDDIIEGSTNEGNTYSYQTPIEKFSTSIWVTDLPQRTTDEIPASAQTSTEDAFTSQLTDDITERSTNKENEYSVQTSIKTFSTAMWVTDIPRGITDESPASTQISTSMASPTEDAFTVQSTDHIIGDFTNKENDYSVQTSIESSSTALWITDDDTESSTYGEFSTDTQYSTQEESSKNTPKYDYKTTKYPRSPFSFDQDLNFPGSQYIPSYGNNYSNSNYFPSKDYWSESETPGRVYIPPFHSSGSQYWDIKNFSWSQYVPNFDSLGTGSFVPDWKDFDGSKYIPNLEDIPGSEFWKHFGGSSDDQPKSGTEKQMKP